MTALDRLCSIALEWLVRPEGMPHFEPPRYARRWMRLWHYPSLRGPWVSLFLYEGDARRFQPSGSSPLFEVAWDRPADAKLVRGADPTARAPATPSVAWRRCLVATETVRRSYDALQHLVFRPFAPSGLGTDGFTRGVEARLGLGSTSIAWWGNTPDGMAPLVRWYEETWNDVQRGLDAAQRAGGA